MSNNSVKYSTQTVSHVVQTAIWEHCDYDS